MTGMGDDPNTQPLMIVLPADNVVTSRLNGVTGALIATTAVIVTCSVIALTAYGAGRAHTTSMDLRNVSATRVKVRTKRVYVRTTVQVTVPAPEPSQVDENPIPAGAYDPRDQAFLDAIAYDGIVAPDAWAIKAGNATCYGLIGADMHGYAYRYLTAGGIKPEHVDTFLSEWNTTHPECAQAPP